MTARHLIFFFLVFGGAIAADQYQYDTHTFNSNQQVVEATTQEYDHE